MQALPEAEKAPGAVKVVAMGTVDRQRAVLTPPPGTLILKLYYRAFMREGNELRYLTDNDLWHDELFHQYKWHVAGAFMTVGVAVGFMLRQMKRSLIAN